MLIHNSLSTVVTSSQLSDMYFAPLTTIFMRF
jgi:hypothetical protein